MKFIALVPSIELDLRSCIIGSTYVAAESDLSLYAHACTCVRAHITASRQSDLWLSAKLFSTFSRAMHFPGVVAGEIDGKRWPWHGRVAGQFHSRVTQLRANGAAQARRYDQIVFAILPARQRYL